MREWLLGLAPAALVAYFLLYPAQLVLLLNEVTRFFR
jgi:hypothetical protein